MKIIIAGGGKLGASLTRQLSLEGYDLTLIDSNAKVLEDSVVRYDVMTIHGNCASMSTLLQADIKKADLLIAVTNADELNLLCCMTAHGLNPNLHTIARIRNPEYTDQIYKMRDLFALSMIVNPEKQAAKEIERLLKYPGFLKRDTFARGRAEIVELRVDAKSSLNNLALNDLYGIAKCKVLICAVLRDGLVAIPDGNFRLHEGDRIFVTASTNDLTILLKNLGIFTHKVKRVLICGGSRVSFYLARALQKSDMSVEIIEQNESKCIHLSQMLPNATIVQGDASSQIFLESEGLTDSDALITATGIDELNIIVSLYGHSCGVRQIITKLSHIKGSLADSLPIGSTISANDLCCASIVRYVRAMHNQTGAALSVHSIADGQVEAMEFVVNENTRHCNEPLKNLQLKRNVLLVCISHRANLEIPNGDSTYSVGDTIIVITTNHEVIYQLNDIFA